MPYISVLIRILHPIQNLLHSIVLVRAQNHQAFIALVHDDIFADHLAQCTLVEEMDRKLIQLVHRFIIRKGPFECKLVSAIGIICKVPGVDTVGYHEDLDVVEQSPKRCFLVALNLIISLLELYTTFLEFNLD